MNGLNVLRGPIAFYASRHPNLPLNPYPPPKTCRTRGCSGKKAGLYGPRPHSQLPSMLGWTDHEMGAEEGIFLNPQIREESQSPCSHDLLPSPPSSDAYRLPCSSPPVPRPLLSPADPGAWGTPGMLLSHSSQICPTEILGGTPPRDHQQGPNSPPEPGNPSTLPWFGHSTIPWWHFGSNESPRW